MIPYLQLERTTAGVIPTNGNMLFDTTVGKGGTEIVYNDNGVIRFYKVGVYYVSWYVAQQTGLATDGKNFALVTSDGKTITGSSHVKIAPASGFAIIEITNPDRTIRLVNKSDQSATLSSKAQVKAGLAVFDISASNPSLGYMQARRVDAAPLELDDTDPVPFDENVNSDPFGIVTLVSHDIIVNDTGTFLVTWDIPVDATELNAYAHFALKVDGTQRGSSFMPLPVGVMSGSALVVIQDKGAVITLVNISGDKVRVAHPVNITVTQISHVAPVTP